MHVSERRANPRTACRRRNFHRHDVRCRARIVIGTRHYAGYVDNISVAGARLRTISPIGKPGNVLLKLPDLPPLRCRLRWSDSHHAGVAFELLLSGSMLSAWLQGRSETAVEREFVLWEADE
jgi:hypothetical protein